MGDVATVISAIATAAAVVVAVWVGLVEPRRVAAAKRKHVANVAWHLLRFELQRLSGLSASVFATPQGIHELLSGERKEFECWASYLSCPTLEKCLENSFEYSVEVVAQMASIEACVKEARFICLLLISGSEGAERLCNNLADEMRKMQAELPKLRELLGLAVTNRSGSSASV